MPDENVPTVDGGGMQGTALNRLFDRYAREQGIEVFDAGIDAFADSRRRGLRVGRINVRCPTRG